MGFMRSAVLSALALAAACRGVAIPAAEAEPSVEKRASTYWYENIAKQGVAPFAPSGYTVYRNVKDFGAKGILFSLAPLGILQLLTWNA